ncbi:MAG: hypothetical protein ACM359_08525 [Bacillota bacterium]
MTTSAPTAVFSSPLGVSPADRWNRFFSIAIPCVVLLGILCRLALFLSRQSYWGDEAYLLLNLRHYSLWRILTGRLDYVPSTQAAPPLFLLILKGAMHSLGSSECAMRLLPFLSSALALLLFARLARHLLPPFAAFWPVALLAFSDKLITQSATLKQYSGDVLVAIILLLIAFPRQSTSPTRRLINTALAASLTLWLSHTTAFVFTAISLALFPQFVCRPTRNLPRYFLIHLPVVVSFFVLYFFSIRAQRDPFLVDYWSESFIDYAHPLQIPKFVLENTWELFAYPARPVAGILLFPAVFGILSLHRSGKHELLVTLVAPILLVFLAAAIHQYPFTAGRITLFLVPFELLLSAHAIPTLGTTLCRVSVPSCLRASEFGSDSSASHPVLPPPFHLILWVLPACVLTLMLVLLPSRTFFHDDCEHLRPAIEHLLAHRQPAEPIYILGEEESAVFRCYHSAPDSLTYFNLPLTTHPTADRFWLLFRADRLRKLTGDSPLTQPHLTLDESSSFHPRTGGLALHFLKSPPSATQPTTTLTPPSSFPLPSPH